MKSGWTYIIKILCCVFVLIGGYSIFAYAQASLPGCAISRLERCPNSNALFADEAFVNKVSRFLGARHTPYFERATIADQALEALGGPADPPRHFGSFWRFTACRPHSCTEKAAVVLRTDGQIVAVALLHSACVPPSLDCITDETLTIYSSNGPEVKGVIEDLSSWASLTVANAGVPKGVTKPKLSKVETVSVISRK